MYNPAQLMCQKCEHLKRNCSHLNFKEMKVVDVYMGVSKIVKCTEYKKRGERG